MLLYPGRLHNDLRLFVRRGVFGCELGSAVLCGLSAKITSILLSSFMPEKLATVFAIAVGGIVYLAALILLRAISEEDIKKFPKGEKLAKLYVKLPGKKK